MNTKYMTREQRLEMLASILGIMLIVGVIMAIGTYADLKAQIYTDSIMMTTKQTVAAETLRHCGDFIATHDIVTEVGAVEKQLPNPGSYDAPKSENECLKALIIEKKDLGLMKESDPNYQNVLRLSYMQ